MPGWVADPSFRVHEIRAAHPSARDADLAARTEASATLRIARSGLLPVAARSPESRPGPAEIRARRAHRGTQSQPRAKRAGIGTEHPPSRTSSESAAVAWPGRGAVENDSAASRQRRPARSLGPCEVGGAYPPPATGPPRRTGVGPEVTSTGPPDSIRHHSTKSLPDLPSESPPSRSDSGSESAASNTARAGRCRTPTRPCDSDRARLHQL